MVSNGSGGLHARKVLTHRRSVSSRFRSRPQVGPFTNSLFIPPAMGKAHTTRLLAQTHVCLARGSPPQLGRISSQNTFQ